MAILLPSPAGVVDCHADDINDNGMIVGGYTDRSGYSHLLAWTNWNGSAPTILIPPQGYQFTAVSGHDTPSMDRLGNIACFVCRGSNNNNTSFTTNPTVPCYFKWSASLNNWSPTVVDSTSIEYNDNMVISTEGQIAASFYGSNNQIISWQSPTNTSVFSMPTTILYPSNIVFSDVFFVDDSNHAIGDCSINNSASYQGAIWDLTESDSPPFLLLALPGYNDNQAHAINHNGWVVGWANGDVAPVTVPILWTNSTNLPVTLKIPPSATYGVVFSINDSNHIVGIEGNTKQMRALIYSGTNMAFLPLVNGYTNSAAVKINNKGVIAGAMASSNNTSKACIWAPIITPTVNFTQPATPVVYSAAKTFSLSASTTSAGTITYSSSSPKVISVSGSTATVKGVGTAIITATSASTANFTAAYASRSVTVIATTPTVNFTQPKSPIDYAAGKTFSLSATSTSAGTITYSSSAPRVISVSGSKATVKGVGTAIITATSASTANFTAASATRSVTVK